MALSKEQIEKADDLPRKKLRCPEWGKGAGDKDAYVWIHTLTAEERDELEAETMGDVDKDPKVRFKNLRARWVARCMRDDEGVPLFTTPEDVIKLGGKSALTVDRAFALAQKLNGFTREDLAFFVGD